MSKDKFLYWTVGGECEPEEGCSTAMEFDKGVHTIVGYVNSFGFCRDNTMDFYYVAVIPDRDKLVFDVYGYRKNSPNTQKKCKSFLSAVRYIEKYWKDNYE